MKAAALLCALLPLVTGGCATIDDAFSIDEVKPWQRDVLAEEGMQLVSDTMDGSVDDHLYYSREASTGGAGVRGGGCGCN